MLLRRLLVTAALVTVVTASCSTSGRALSKPRPDQTASLTVASTSTAPTTTVSTEPMAIHGPWAPGQRIPDQYTCRGANRSPALAWTGVPPAAVELALVVTDTSASDAVRWVVAALSPDVPGIDENDVPSGAIVAKNATGTASWAGPCPSGTDDTTQHRYVITLYALGDEVDVLPAQDAVGAVTAITGSSSVLTSATLAGTYPVTGAAGAPRPTGPDDGNATGAATTDDLVVHEAAWAELDPQRLHDLLKLRCDVFVVEQACAYPDVDGRDVEPTTRHLWIDTGDLRPAASLRLLREPSGAARIGRVVTHPHARRHGLSGRLVTHVLATRPGPFVLHAQSHLVGFYARFGFAVAGPEYVEDGIPHTPMRRPPQSR